MRYFNVTFVDLMGAPTTVQVLADRLEVVLGVVRERAFQASQSRRTTDVPFVAVFVFDTAPDGLLLSFAVDRQGRLEPVVL